MADYYIPPPRAADWASPLVGFQIGDRIADLPRRYYEGAAAANQLEAQRAFSGGIPRNPDGTPNLGEITDTGARIGGLDYVSKLTPFLIQQEFLRQGQKMMPSSSFSSSPSETGTAPQPQSSIGGAAPSGPVAADAPGAKDTLRTIVTETFPGRDLSAAIPRLAASIGVNADQPLSKEDAQAVRSRLTQGGSASSSDNAPARVGGNAGVMGGDGAPPSVPSSGTSGAPGPVEAPSQPSTQSPATRPAVPSAGGVTRPPTEGYDPRTAAANSVIPPQYRGREMEYANFLDRQAEQRLNAATMMEAGGVKVDAQKSIAANEHALAQLIREALTKGLEPTEAIKNYMIGRSGQNEGLVQFQARQAGEQARAKAPYEIATAAVREGARVYPAKPNDVLTTGSQVDPTLNAITGWAAQNIPGMSVLSEGGGPPAPPPGAPVAGPGTAPAGPQGQPGGPPMPAPGEPVPAPGPGPGAPAPGPGGQVQPPPQQTGSAFRPGLVRVPGGVASTVTPATEALLKRGAENYEKAAEAFHGAQSAQQQLISMYEAARELNKAGWSTMGTGAESRLKLAKAVNTFWTALGQEPVFDPKKIASWEELSKESTRLGFALARTLGAREAMQIVQGAISANPNIANTEAGFSMVWNTLWQNQQQMSDYFVFATNWAKDPRNGGDLTGAEIAFARQFPPSLYVRRARVAAEKAIPPEDIETLSSTPNLAPKFDEKYGKGAAALFLPPRQ